MNRCRPRLPGVRGEGVDLVRALGLEQVDRGLERPPRVEQVVHDDARPPATSHPPSAPSQTGPHAGSSGKRDAEPINPQCCRHLKPAPPPRFPLSPIAYVSRSPVHVPDELSQCLAVLGLELRHQGHVHARPAAHQLHQPLTEDPVQHHTATHSTVS